MLQVAVIIPTRNRRGTIVRTLTSLARQNVPFETFEVIVVADGCDDDTADAVRSLELPYLLQIVEQPALGPSAARQRGAMLASAPLLLFLDDDMEASPELIRAHCAFHESHPGGVVLGYFPQYLPEDADVFAVTVKLWWDAGFADRSHPAHRFCFRDLCNGNVSLSKELLDRVGGCDPDFRPGVAGEDYELGIRLMKHHVRFRFAANASSIHHDRPTPGRLLRRASEQARGDVCIAKKHPELFPALRLQQLSRFDERWWKSLAWRVLWRWPSLGSTVAWPLRVLMAGSVALKMRGLLDRCFSCVQGYYYFLGVRAALGSRAEWNRLVASTRQSPQNRVIEIDVAKDLPELDRILETACADSAILTYRGAELARLGHQFGAEPLRPAHVRHFLIHICNFRLMSELLFDELANDSNTRLIPRQQRTRRTAHVAAYTPSVSKNGYQGS